MWGFRTSTSAGPKLDATRPAVVYLALLKTLRECMMCASTDATIEGAVKFHVQPIYGWGWSSDNQSFEVPGPFQIETVVNEYGGLKTASGMFYELGHALSAMWIVLSPIQAANTWEWSHICAFPDKPTIPEDLKTLIESAPLTGFAKAFRFKKKNRRAGYEWSTCR